MVKVKDINPVFPLTPTRPVNEADRRHPEQDRKRRREDDPPRRDQADDDRQIDEYA